MPRHIDIKIHFLGVWDTVGALGIPEEMSLKPRWRIGSKRFHNARLSSIVKTARHAVAIDERRQTFAPTLWEEPNDGERIIQRWFSGVHGDVGGGYAADELGNVTLGWMMRHAQAAGLVYRDGATAQVHADPQGILHNSLKGVFSKLQTRPRAVPNVRDDREHIYKFARGRHQVPPLIQSEYWRTDTLEPGETRQVDVFAKERWNATSLFLETGATYHFSADGEWLDGDIPCSPEGPLTKLAWLRPRYRRSALANFVQMLARNRNPNISVPFASRENDMPRFSLVGVIANGTGVDDRTKSLNKHQTFCIGRSHQVSPSASGYLYCFANDVWTEYENNRGSVQLTIHRAV